ncbi:MAG: diol dehydratase small subunit, partial [Desulfofundulus sp.]
MMQENLIEEIVREVLKSLQTNPASAPACSAKAESKTSLDPARDYPLATKHPELVKTPTGKSLSEITLEAVLKG